MPKVLKFAYGAIITVFIIALIFILAQPNTMTEEEMVGDLLTNHGWAASCDEPARDPENPNLIKCNTTRMVKLTPRQKAQMDSAVKATPDSQAPHLPFDIAYPEIVEK